MLSRFCNGLWRLRGLVYMESRDKVDVDTFHMHKGIQYALEKLGKSKFGLVRTAVSNLKAKDTTALGTSLLIIPELRALVLTKRHVGSGNEIGKAPFSNSFVFKSVFEKLRFFWISVEGRPKRRNKDRA